MERLKAEMRINARVSVRDLVAAACPPRDLSRGSVSRTAALTGIREHIRLQAQQPEGYLAEVPVSLIRQLDDLSLEVFGRMDGMMESPDRLLVEEIKTCRTDPSLAVREPDLRHLAQLKCYGHMAAVEKKVNAVTLKLTYVRPATGDIAAHEFRAPASELEDFFNGILTAYLKILSTRSAWQRLRNQSIADLTFPFDAFRQGQRDLAESVYKIIKHKKLLFARAPTGTGKTMACLFPAVKAMGEGHADKIFYLTAKTPGQTVASQAVAALARGGARIRSVVITAKQKVCFLPDQPCDMETCPFARAYFTKLAKARTHLAGLDQFERETILGLAAQYDLCPFELSLDLSLDCDIIICDVNYAFDPRVYLKRFFDRNTENLVFLMDEAHNLPDRLRSMYSGTLETSLIAEAETLLKTDAPDLALMLSAVREEMAGLGRTAAQPDGFAALSDLPGFLLEAMDDFYLAADLWLDRHPDAPVRQALLDIFFPISAFLSLARYFGSHYRVFVRNLQDSATEVTLFCLDPSPVFIGLIRRCSSAVFFSATFFPFDFYQQVLLGTKAVPGDDGPGEAPQASDLTPYTIALPSPFPPGNFKLIIHRGLETTFRRRHLFYDDMARAITLTVLANPGNYLVFFPSYAFLESVLACMDLDTADIRVQSSGMTEEERKGFVEAFSPDSAILGFAVMGGIFGEGIDLPGNRLIGVMIAGVGLPQVCEELDEIRAYYDSQGQDGFFIAYQMPGWSRVLQAAGRLIRTRSDRGVVLLMDRRFLRPDYQQLFPGEWQSHAVLESAGQLRQALDDFWHPSG